MEATWRFQTNSNSNNNTNRILLTCKAIIQCKWIWAVEARLHQQQPPQLQVNPRIYWMMMMILLVLLLFNNSNITNLSNHINSNNLLNNNTLLPLPRLWISLMTTMMMPLEEPVLLLSLNKLVNKPTINLLKLLSPIRIALIISITVMLISLVEILKLKEQPTLKFLSVNV